MKTEKVKNIDIARCMAFMLYKEDNPNDNMLYLEAIQKLCLEIVLEDSIKFYGNRVCYLLSGKFDELNCTYRINPKTGNKILSFEDESEVPVEKWNDIKRFMS